MNITKDDNLTQTNNDEELDIRKSIIQLFNSKEYQELKLYYGDKSFFDILGIMRNENIHSNFWTWLLSPEQNHGLNEYPIRKFLEMVVLTIYDCNYIRQQLDLFPDYIIDYIITGNYEVTNVKIEREKVISNNSRIDIFIDLTIKYDIDEEKSVNLKIIIENKVYSKEHLDQTIKYYNWAKENFINDKSELLFLFLSPISNSELCALEEQQCKCKKYIQINYQYLVDYVLEPCKRQQLNQESSLLIDNYLRCLSFPSTNEKDILNGGSVMAISKREKNLLLDFWEANKPLLLAMLNVLKDDDSIDDQERTNMENMITSISNKSSKDFSKYIFKGNKYYKNRLVLAIVSDYAKSKNADYQTLLNAFPKSIQGSYGVFEIESNVKEKSKNRFFTKPEEIIITSDNKRISVCTQWGAGNIEKFVDLATKVLGYDIKRED